MNLNDQIDWSDTDRIVSNDTRYVQLAGDWWRETSTYQTRQNGSPDLTLMSRTRTRLAGLDRARTPSAPQGLLVAESHSYDALDNETILRTTLDRGTHTTTRTTTSPASTLPAETVARCGLTISSRSPTGVTTTYAYDAEGRVLAQRGATYPVDYAYDVYGNKVSMTTYRNEDLTNGDTTRWLYDEPSGCMTNKVYADGKGPTYSYTPDGKLARRTWARGIVTDYTYDTAGQLVSTTYSDTTPTITMSYDRVGNMTEATTAGVVTNLYAYNIYGNCTNEWQNDFNLTRYYDTFGRNTGYAINGNRQTVIGYDTCGRISTMQVPAAEESLNLHSTTTTPNYNSFHWNYLQGSDLKASLQYPNGLTASWQYDANNQLLQVCNATPTNIISQFDYTYDAAGRRIAMAKSGSAMSQEDTIDYAYNIRSELTNALARADADYNYAYAYDDIGNRISSSERGTNTVYEANELNQYTAVDDFTPEFDADGNQTLVKTSTGIWRVTYNGENRPVLWTRNLDGLTISMSFDCDGRRVVKNEQRFFYNRYVQIADACGNHYVWDPTQPVITQPLVWGVCLSGKVDFCIYTHDGSKNVSEVVPLVGEKNILHHDYTPFGLSLHTMGVNLTTLDNVWRASSEYFDDALATSYYNFRHYSVESGRWLSRDILDSSNLYLYVANLPFLADVLGLYGNDVHFDFVYLFLEMLQRDGVVSQEVDIYEIARGSLAPDEYARTSPFWGGVESQMLFHNLNGLAADKVRCYRQCVRCLANNESDEFTKGLYLHVLGDTYAHTKDDGSAYPQIIGHGMKGTSPDDVSQDVNKFLRFAEDLASVFEGADSVMGVLTARIQELLEQGLSLNDAISSIKDQSATASIEFTPSMYGSGFSSQNPDVDKIKKARGRLNNCLDCVNGGNKK